MKATLEMNQLEAVETIAESVIATADAEAPLLETQVLDEMHAQATALELRVEALSQRLAALEQAATRRIDAGAETGTRKTVPAGVTTLLSKHGLGTAEGGTMEAGSSLARVDAALTALPIEQRIAVKAELLRAGLL